jgi:hypothetical protein
MSLNTQKNRNIAGLTPIVLILGVLVLSCFPPRTVDSLVYDTCSLILDDQLLTRYKHTNPELNDKIVREDFVKKYNDFISEKIVENHLPGATLEDPLTQELMRLKMIGAYGEGNNLRIVNTQLIIVEEHGINEFQEWEIAFRHYLNSGQGGKDLNDFQSCIYGAMNKYFENLILVGPDDREAIIPLQFSERERFK